jgi:4-diphosphocytidyl-2-C-methyl-D-erythritol kinase
MLAPFLLMRALERDSPCKVNLLLDILHRRPDGFHALETILHPVPLFDSLRFERAGASLALSCNLAELPADGSNLVHRAASSFLTRAGVRDGVRIHLEKRLPLAAGLGGGSANAAITLLALDELFGQPLGPGVLAELAASLGSDVPFFLQPKPALATGRGESIQPHDWFPALRGARLLLIHPGFGVPTAWAYQNLARFPAALSGQPGRAASLLALLRQSDLTAAGAGFYNSLEAPVLAKYPILALYQEFLRAEGAAAALMSGSGSTTFALTDGEEKAGRLRDRFHEKFGARAWTAVVALGPQG